MDMHTNRLKEILLKLGCTPRKLESIQFFEDYLNQLNKILTQDIVFQFTSENSEIICNSIRAFTNIFLFCKDTSVHLEEEKNKPQVAALFKNSYKNLKVSINILDGWYLCFKDSFDDFKNVLHSMFDCINVLVYLDVMAAASVFKSFKGLYVHHKNLILKHISDFKWLVTICDVVELLLLKNFQDDIPKTFLHNIRFYKFIIGLALQITVDLKDAFDDAGKKIFFFACSVQRISMKHCHATQDLYLLLEATVKTCVKELLHLKNASPQFFKMLVTEKMNIVDDGLVHLVLFSRMLSELKDRFKDDIPLHWCSSENKDSLIGLFFNLLISLPSVFENNKILLQSSFGLVNVYEYLLMNLCSYIANLPPSCIQNVSDILFSTLLTSSVTFIFAADLLSFIARWSNEELCLQYIIALGKMLVKLGSMGLEASAGCNNMALLFRRMFLFLNEQQLDIKLFMRDYTFSQSIYLWIHMPLAKLKCEADDINKIATVAISVIQLNGEEQNDSDSNVVAAIQVLCNISQNFFNLLTASNQRTILQEVVQFWSCFCDLEEDIEMSESVVVTMLGLASYIFRFFQPKEMFLILSVLRDILLNCDDQLFRLQVTWFLSELKCVRFHESVQSECISIVACLFNYLIDHNDWVVSFFAMSALRDYAEVTVYSQAVSSFLPLNKKTDFTNFLKKESKQHWSVLQQNMHETLRDNKTITKKCDVRSDVEDSIRECLTNISHNIEILKNLLSSSTLPSFCQVEVEKLIDSLSFTIMKKCSKKPETFDNNAL